MGLTPVFDLARRALATQEIVLHTAGQNIANANRAGYTRQEAQLVAGRSQTVGGVLIGGGVRVEAIRQVIDPLLEGQLLASRSDKASAEAARNELSGVESVFDPFGGSGIHDALNAFFAAADDLALNPQGIPERSTFLSQAETLALRIQERASQLATIQRQVDDRIAQAVSRANGFIGEIATLNKQIFSAELGNQNANDLQDQRREALGSLAEETGVTAIDVNGGLTVVGPDGLSLVQGDGTNAILVDSASSPTLTGLDGRSLSRVGFAVGGGGFVSFTKVDGGELAGLLQVRDTDIPQVAASLDQLANALRTAVNAVHTNGEDLDGNAGTALFGGTNAATMSVLITNPRAVAASVATSGPPNNTPEDNQNALALAALSLTPLDGTSAALGNADLQGATLVDFQSTIVSSLGTMTATAVDRAEAAQALATELDQRRAALSGVSLNEELLSLLSAQRSFQAAAMLISTATATIDTVLELAG